MELTTLGLSFELDFELEPPGKGLSFGRGDPSHRSRLAFQEVRSSFLVAEDDDDDDDDNDNEGVEVAAVVAVDVVEDIKG